MPSATGAALKQILGAQDLLLVLKDPSRCLTWQESAGESYEALTRRSRLAFKDFEEVLCEDLDPLESAKSSRKVTTQAFPL